LKGTDLEELIPVING